MTQLSNPTHKDWISQVLKELEDLNIKLEIEQIASLSKEKYREIIKEAVYRKAFSDLLQRKQSRQSEHAKVKTNYIFRISVPRIFVSKQQRFNN